MDEALFGGSTGSSALADARNPTQVRSTSYQKKFIGFQVVNQLLQLLPVHFQLAQNKAGYAAVDALLSSPSSQSQVLSLVFRSRNFLRTFSNNLSSRKNILYGMSLLVKKTLLRFGAAHPTEILAIVSALEDSSAGGHMRFDARTNSNTVLKLLEGLDIQGVQAYVDKIVKLFVNAAPIAPTPADAEDAAAAAAASLAAAAKKAGAKKGSKAAAAPVAVAAPASSSAAASAIDSVDHAELAQQSLDSTRQFCLEQLFALARNKNLPHGPADQQEGSWLHRILQFFLYYGFMDSVAAAKGGPFPDSLAHPLSAKVQALLAEKLFHLLDELLPHAPVSKRALATPSGHAEKKIAADKAKAAAAAAAKKKAAADDEDEEMADSSAAPVVDEKESLASYNSLFSVSGASLPWALRVHQDWVSWTSGKKPLATMIAPLSKDHSAARATALEFIQGLREKYEKLFAKTSAADAAPSEEDKSQLAQLRSLQLLLLHLSLLLLKDDEREFAAPLLDEVQEGVTGLFAPKKAASKSKKAAAAAAAAEDDKPEFINVLVDILLSLLIRPSNLFRDISRSVFSAFASSVNDQALQDLMEVLRKKDKQPGAEGDDEDENSDDFNSDNDEEESDEEMDAGKKKKDGKDADKKKAAPVASNKSTGKKLSKLDLEAAENAKKFAHLAAGAGSGSDDDEDDEQMLDIEGLNKVFASSGPEGAEDSDEENLEKSASYDVHLGNIVRLRNERKTVHKEYATQALHFKLRVCDLVEVFMRSQATNPLILQLFLPMLLAIDASRGNKDSQQLQQKLVTLYKQLCGSKERPAMTPELQTQVRELQTLLMARALRSVHRETLHLTNVALLFLTKISIPNEIAEQVAATEAALAPAPAAAASSSKKSSKSAAAVAPVDSGVSVALNLYRTELVKYISVKHSLLNTKFFTDFCTRFPGLAWSFVGPLAELAQAKLPDSHQASAKKGAAATADHPYAANAFLRNDCFILLGTIFGNRHVLKDHDVSAKFATALPAIQEAIRSTLVASTLPRTPVEVAEEAAAKIEDAESSDDEEEEEKDGDKKGDKKEGGKDARQLKKEREKQKARAKKKRRELKKREAARAAAIAAGKGPNSPEALKQAEHEAAKSNVARLKIMLKFANQAALAFAPASASTSASASPLCNSGVQAALNALPATLATPLKSTLYTFLQSARVEKDSLKLQIDDALLQQARSKPNPNLALKKPAAGTKGAKAAAPAAGSAKKSAPAAAASKSPAKPKSASPAASKSPKVGAPSPKKRALEESASSKKKSSSNGAAKEGEASKKQKL